VLKDHSSFVKQTIAVIDGLLIAAAFGLSHHLVSLSKGGLYPILDYWMVFVGFLSFYLYFAWTRHLFSVLQFTWMKGLFGRIVAIFGSAAVLGASILYLMHDPFNSRALYVVFTGFSFLFIMSEKMLLMLVFDRARRANRNISPVIVFGRGRLASLVVKRIAAHPEWGLRVIRKVDISVSTLEFEEILKSLYVEEVFFCIPRSLTKNGFRIDPYLHLCEEMGRPARVFLNIPNATNFARWEYHSFMDYPTLISHTVELDPDQLIFKRALDVVAGGIGFMVFLACYPVLATLIKLTSPGPIFFKQIRVGKNGKRFIIYKFRTMFRDAEQRKKDLMAHNELSGAVFKMKNDPRVTPLGDVLRKLSLDEIPQVINVIKGEMSLVGTRPPTPDEVARYEKWHHRRISIRPGITGLWQVSGRNRITDFDEIVRLDLKYIDTWSLWLDIKIILRTILVLCQRRGAY
jgi:exopolysaccharide biosynthesis polyprenyl glycosylphosphotransferase